MDEHKDGLAYIIERQAQIKEASRLDQLAKSYMKNTVKVKPKWDKNPTSYAHNDTDKCHTLLGMVLFEIKTSDLYLMIDDSWLYEADTLWKHHDNKIARIIEHWQNGQSLSAPFFLMHSVNKKILVADGKHRLTTARAMNAETVPFFVKASDAHWIKEILPMSKMLGSTTLN